MDKDFPKTDVVAALEVVYDALSLAVMSAMHHAPELTAAHQTALARKLAAFRTEVTAMGHHAIKAGDAFEVLKIAGAV